MARHPEDLSPRRRAAAPAGPSPEDALHVADLVSRRPILAVPALLAFPATAACAKEEGAAAMPGSKTLVAYLTRSGNMRVIAGTLQRALGADLFEIRPAQPYPEDYARHVTQAQRERDSCYAPPLAERVANFASRHSRRMWSNEGRHHRCRHGSAGARDRPPGGRGQACAAGRCT
ncbi:flavodoxin [Sphingomonas elodea]|uniref:flavodoxin n=1 Tax=Sphingomonas elodea TaxID=179878 RepID=UPI003B42970C